MRVAMRGDHRIARIARLRRAIEMPRAERERASRGAGQHENVCLRAGTMRRAIGCVSAHGHGLTALPVSRWRSQALCSNTCASCAFA